jgi:hypothetical protein
VLLSALVLGAGCDLLGKSGPEEVRLEIDGRAGEQIRLITSGTFLTDRIQDIRDDGSALDSLAILLLAADTITVDLPYLETYDISKNQRFYVRMNRLAPTLDSLVARMWIDGELKFERKPASDRDSLQFIYNFRGAPGQDNVEL